MLHNLLEALCCLPITFNIVEEPASKITCLGININADTGILTLRQVKISQIKD